MYVSVSGELITVYFECSEKKKGQIKRKEKKRTFLQLPH